MPNAQSRENYFHCCHNKSSLKGGMHSNTAVTHDSPWNCLSQRLAQIGLIPHDVGGSGDCFFKSVSQFYGNADRHVEIRMAGISHLHNYPELYIESISDESWEDYIRQMSLPGTWCDHLIIQADTNNQNISRLQCVKRKYVSEYNKDNDLPKKLTNSKNQLSEGAAEKKQERLAKKEPIVKSNCLRKLLKKGKNDLQKREPIVKSNCLEELLKKGRNDLQK